MEKILTDKKTGNKKAVATPDYKFKTFDQLKKDLDSSNKKIKKFPPPLNKKNDSSVNTNNRGGVRGDLYDVSSFKNSF
tara:strand:- start:364 stop:597 length:234 start_codon:yes stop_codon:yes gene_type:complete